MEQVRAFHAIFLNDPKIKSGNQKTGTAGIVKAVNALPYESRGTFVKLREPEPARKIHTTQAEGCCGRQIGKASLAGKLESVTRFECPTCGTTYESRTEGPLTVWEARADVLVFKSR